MNFLRLAKGKRPLGVMNRLETQFSLHLEELKNSGEILWWSYESIRLRLADNTTYTPDFFVMNKDLELQVFETKGRWIEPGRTKIKVAAEKFPFRFFGVMKDKRKGGWVYEEFSK